MNVRNFFTKAVAETTGCFAFFNGVILDVEGEFRAYFEWNDYFYIKVHDGEFIHNFIRIKCFPSNGGYFLREVEEYNPISGLYEPLTCTERDRKFLHHVVVTCSIILASAKSNWNRLIESIQF